MVLWASVGLVVLQLAFTDAPPLQFLFKTVELDGVAWTLILVLGAVTFLAVEAEKAVLRHFGVQRL